MASAVGLAASVIAIIQLAATATSLSYGYFSSVKDAPESAKKFMDELTALNRVLSTLEGCAQANPESAVLKELEEPVRKCVEEMQDISKKLDPANQRWLKKKLARYKWPLKESQTSAYIKRLERHKSFFIIVLNSDALTRTKAIGTNVEEMMADVKDLKISIVDLNTRAAQNSVHLKRNKILEWLSPGIFDRKHNEISGRRQRDTGDWFLRIPEFQDWTKKNPNSPLLCGYGIPGAGKTFISSRVIDHLLSQKIGGSYGVAYIYFDYKERDQQRPAQVIACLTKQLLCQTRSPIPKEIEAQHTKFNEEIKTPTLQEQYNIFLIAIKSFTQTFIICDALDECDQKTQRRELLPLFHRMGQAGINLFLTSREYPEDIQASLQNSSKVRIFAQEEDITRYVERKIEENPRARRLVNQGKCKEEITNGLIECAKGMFLLVHFHIEYLCQQTTVREILTELEKLKSTSNEDNPLGPTYDRAMDALRVQPKNCVGLAHRVLTWLVKAKRILKVGELQLAVSVEQDRTSLHEFDLPDKKTLLEVCASLVTIDEQGDTIELAHYTVHEYLLKNSIIPADADLKVAMACTTFLSFDVFAQGACTSNSSLEARHTQHPFLRYAADYLYHHIQACDEALSTEFVLRFVKRPGCILSYQQALSENCDYGNEDRFDKYPKDRSPLHVAAYLGHCVVAQLLLKEINSMYRKTNTGLTALHVAAGQGHERVAQLLIENGADPSAVYVSTYITETGETPLSHAVLKGHKRVVLLLLEKGAKTSLKDHVPLLNYVPLLCLGGEESMVRLLVDKGVNLEDKNSTDCGSTPLMTAIQKKDHELTRLLLELGADYSAYDSNGSCVLGLAVFLWHEKTFKLLLEKGADISQRNIKGHTGLHYATMIGIEDIVRFLVNEGIDISAEDDEGMTALHFAAGLGHESIVQFLLEKGADLMAKDKMGRLALHCAAIEAKEPMIKMLFEKGAEISLDVADNNGSTLLHLIVDGVGCGDVRKSIVRFLLQKGINPSAVDNNGQTALGLAERRGRDSLLHILEAAMHGHPVEMNEEYVSLEN